MADLEDQKEAAEELKDLTNALNDLVGQLGQKASEVTDELKGWGRQSLDLVSLFDRIVARGKGIPESIKSGKDLMEALKKGAVEFDSIRKKTMDLNRRELNEIWAKKVASLENELQLSGELLEQHPQFIDAQLKMQTLREQQKRDLDTSLQLLQRHVETQQEMTLHVGNVTKKLNEWGDMLKNPGKAIDSVLGKMGEMPGKIGKAVEESGGLGSALKNAAAGGMDKLAKGARLLFSPAGLLIAGVAAAVAAVVGLVALFKNFWEFIDKNVLPAMADFNKQIGGSTEATAKLQGQMAAMGDRFDRLGVSFQEGAQAVRSVADGLKTVELDPKTLKTGTELAAILGLTADEIGNMGLQFQKATGSIEGVNKMMGVGAAEATKYGLPVNAVLKDMAKAPNVLARFGTANAKQFAQATAKAQSYGLSIQEVNQAFGEQLDTFEKTADASAKLNTIFGTQINSMELMLETDPTKRMEMLRKELLAQGKSWDKLNEFEKNVITQNLGVDKSQAALVLSSEEERKKLEAKARQREREMKINERWNKGINSLRRTLINWGSELNRVFRSISELVTAMFGLEKPGKLVHKLADTLVSGFQSITKWLRETSKAWREGGDKLSAWGKVAKFVWTVMKTGAKILTGVLLFAVESLLKPITMAIEGWKLLLGTLGETETFKAIADWLNDISEDIDTFFETDIDWSQVWEGAILTVKDIWNEFTGWLEESWDKMVEFFTNIDWFEVGKSVKEGLNSAIEFITSIPDKVMEALNATVEFWTSVDWGGLGKSILDGISGAFSQAVESAKNFGKMVVEAFFGTIKETVASFKDIGSSIMSFFKGGKEKGSSAIGEFMKGFKSVDDAIITKAGKIIETHPNDNILATQAPIQDLLPKMEAPTTTSVNSESMVNELKMLREAITKMSQAKASAPAPTRESSVKVEVVDVNLDGRKVGEAQVRISRF